MVTISEKILSNVLLDGTLRASEDELQEALQEAGLLATWQRVERIVGAELGLPANDEEQADFDLRRNRLFIKTVQDGFDLEVVEAVAGL